MQTNLEKTLQAFWGKRAYCGSGDVCFIFNWESLTSDRRSEFVDDNLLAYYEVNKREFGTRFVPIAMLWPDEELEEDELADLDSQNGGILLVDSEDGSILVCADGCAQALTPYAGSWKAFALRTEPARPATTESNESGSSLDFEQYCDLMKMFIGGQQPQLLKKYSLTKKALKAEMAYWKAQLDAKPELEEALSKSLK